MAWVYLGLAGLLEVAWAVGLKYSDGFTRSWPTTWVFVTMAGSIWLLSLATRTLPLGTAYAVWTGIGAIGASVLGMILFHEARDAARLACISLIVIGVVGLKLVTPTT